MTQKAGAYRFVCSVAAPCGILGGALPAVGPALRLRAAGVVLRVVFKAWADRQLPRPILLVRQRLGLEGVRAVCVSPVWPDLQQDTKLMHTHSGNCSYTIEGAIYLTAQTRDIISYILSSSFYSRHVIALTTCLVLGALEVCKDDALASELLEFSPPDLQKVA